MLQAKIRNLHCLHIESINPHQENWFLIFCSCICHLQKLSPPFSTSWNSVLHFPVLAI